MTSQRHNATIGGLPPEEGLYSGGSEHDSCGVGFVVNTIGEKSHDTVAAGVTVVTCSWGTKTAFWGGLSQ